MRKTGLPPVITSCAQIHFDDSLDTTYRRLSFETITGPPLFFAFETLNR